MNTPTRLFTAGLCTTVLTIAAWAYASTVNPTTVTTTSLNASDELAKMENDPVVAPDPKRDAITVYVLNAMREWNRGPMAGKATHLEEIARDIVVVALDEPRIWKDSDGAQEAILLARIAWFETRFRDYVDDGSCQVWAKICMTWGSGCNLKKLSQEQATLMTLGTCDGGLAIGLHQVHYPYTGIALMPDGSWHNADYFTKAPREIVKREDALTTPTMSAEERSKHRQTNMRVALAMARQSIQNGAGLMAYVGGDGPERVSMAAQRLDSARAWSAKHPFK